MTEPDDTAGDLYAEDNPRYPEFEPPDVPPPPAYVDTEIDVLRVLHGDLVELRTTVEETNERLSTIQTIVVVAFVTWLGSILLTVLAVAFL